MYCPKCGKELMSGSSFCTQCGAKIDAPVKSGSTVSGRKKSSVWKAQYTFICIGVVILLAAFIGLVIIICKFYFYDNNSLRKELAEKGTVAKDRSEDSYLKNKDLHDLEEGSSDEDEEDEEDEEDDEEEAEKDVEAAAPAAEEIFDMDDNSEEDRFNDEGINTYELIVRDTTWTEAYESCLKKGGHLVRINSDDEGTAILNQIYAEGKEDIKFWIGGYRDDNDDYRWVYNDSYNDRYEIIFGDVILNSDPRYKDYWLDGEPSLYDDNTHSEEDCMNMFYLKRLDRWVWNDVPDDVLAVADFYSGNMGYICEYEQ